jgi:hypothetical protein
MNKISRAVELQHKINQQIEVYGEANIYLCDELMEIIDSFTREEENTFLNLYYSVNII